MCPWAHMHVLTYVLPFPNIFADNGMVMRVYDPTREHRGTWDRVTGDMKAFKAACGSLPYDDVQIGPYEFCFMVNPTPHKVTKITKGDRAAVVAFFNNVS